MPSSSSLGSVTSAITLDDKPGLARRNKPQNLISMPYRDHERGRHTELGQYQSMLLDDEGPSTKIRKKGSEIKIQNSSLKRINRMVIYQGGASIKDSISNNTP